MVCKDQNNRFMVETGKEGKMKYSSMKETIVRELQTDPNNVDLWWWFETKEDAIRFRKAFYKWRYSGRSPQLVTRLRAFLEPDRDGGWRVHIFTPKFPEVQV